MFMEIMVAINALLLICSLLPITHLSHWSVRGLDFPRLQLVVISVSLLIIVFIFGNFWQLSFKLCIAMSIFCISYQLFWIRPYTIFHCTEVDLCKNPTSEKSLTILCSNVLMPNDNFDSLIGKIKENNPDIVITLESDIRWENALKSIEKNYPYHIKCPQENLYGMHLYSKLKLSDTQLKYLIEDDIPSIHCKITLRSNDEVQAYFLHPAPPSPTENTYSTQRDAELILVAKTIQKHALPCVVTGDLNDVAWSKTTRLFRRLSGLKDPRIGRGMFNTFHSKYWFMRWPLDHVFHSEQFDLCSMKRLKIQGSDHFSLFTHLHLSDSGKTNSKQSTNESKDLEQDEKDLIAKREDESNLNA